MVLELRLYGSKNQIGMRKLAIDLHIISHPIAITETQMTGKEPTTWTDNGVFTELSDFLPLYHYYIHNKY